MTGLKKKARVGKARFSFSTKSLMLLVFLPLISLFIGVNTYASYVNTENQIREAAIESTSYAVLQSRNYFDSRLRIILDSFILLDVQNQQEIDFCSVAPNGDISFRQYLIDMRSQIDTVHFQFYDQMDSVLVYTNIEDTLLYKSISSPTNYQVNADLISQYSGSGYIWKCLLPSEHPVTTNETQRSTISLLKVFNSKYQNSTGILQYNLKPDYYVSLLNDSDQFMDWEFLIMADDRFLNDEFDGDTSLSSEIIRHSNQNPDSSLMGSFLYKQHSEESFLVIYNTSLINGWKIVALVPYENLHARAKAVTMVSLRNLAVLILLSAILISTVVSLITKPIISLVKKVTDLEDKGLHVFNYNHSILREINSLNQGINHLVEHVKKLLRDVRKEQEEKRQAEFAALSAQINPHFLYNTLFSAKQLCDLGDCNSAGSMIMALSNFYRVSIGGSSEFVSLKKEFILIQNYIEIHKLKFADSLSYNIKLPPSLDEYRIIKMTLQPIVENAIYHGLSCKDGEKRLIIEACLNNQSIDITIEDNGIGITSDKLSVLKQKINTASSMPFPEEVPASASFQSTSIGIMNVQKRIVTYYGEGYGLSIESIPNKGTTVSIRIPVVYPDSFSL